MTGWIAWGQETDARTPAHVRSQQGEWALNGSVQHTAMIGYEEAYFPTRLATVTAVNDDTHLQVDEFVGDPSAYASIPEGSVAGDVLRLQSAGFAVKRGDEIMQVVDRASTGVSGFSFVYTVVRAQEGTPQETVAPGDVLECRYFVTGLDYAQPSQDFGPWQAFDVADSPDNFPQGKYPGDQSRYAPDGTYLFAYPSQTDYVEQQTAWVISQGGQVDGNRFRFPLGDAQGLIAGSQPNDALAAATVGVRTAYYPQSKQVSVP